MKNIFTIKTTTESSLNNSKSPDDEVKSETRVEHKSSLSSRSANRDFPDSLSLIVHTIHPSHQVSQTTSSVPTELLWVGSCSLSKTGTST